MWIHLHHRHLYLGMKFVLVVTLGVVIMIYCKTLMIFRADHLLSAKQYSSDRWFPGCWCLTEVSVQQVYFEIQKRKNIYYLICRRVQRKDLSALC